MPGRDNKPIQAIRNSAQKNYETEFSLNQTECKKYIRSENGKVDVIGASNYQKNDTLIAVVNLKLKI